MAWVKRWRSAVGASLFIIGVGLCGVYVVYVQSPLATTRSPVAVSQSGIAAALTDEYADVIAAHYAPLIPLTIGATTLQVSVADTVATRVQGLSDTPVLPPGLGKLFVFDTDSAWGIWMKDMLYPLDIIWLDSERRIVHIETAVSPATYPESFSSPIPARYVLEINASTSLQYGWEVGDRASW